MSQRFPEPDLSNVTTDAVRLFWQKNPLCARNIPHPLGSREFFTAYDAMRESVESIPYSYALHEYRHFQEKKVLEVGCGNGYVLSKYAAEGAHVFGIDITQAAIDLCSKRFDLIGLQGDFHVCDAQMISFPDNTFDCVCSMGVLHHLPDILQAVNEIYRVLKPGGRLIVMVYHRNSAKYQFKYRVWSWSTGKSIQQLVNDYDGAGNPKGTVFSKSELAGMLSRFTDVRMQVGYLATSDIILRGARYLSADLFRPLAPLIGWNLYAKARKQG